MTCCCVGSSMVSASSSGTSISSITSSGSGNGSSALTGSSAATGAAAAAAVSAAILSERTLFSCSCFPIRRCAPSSSLCAVASALSFSLSCAFRSSICVVKPALSALSVSSSFSTASHLAALSFQISIFLQCLLQLLSSRFQIRLDLAYDRTVFLI